MALSKPTNGSNADYANRIGLLFDAFNNGNYAFPATQVPSADANTLDDYEEGTWTPVLTFGTPGDLSVTYSIQVGDYTKIGRKASANYAVAPSAFTHTTASGNAQITGLPFAASALSNRFFSSPITQWQGITKAGFSAVAGRLAASASLLDFMASTSAASSTNVTAADMPTGGSPIFIGCIEYFV